MFECSRREFGKVVIAAPVAAAAMWETAPAAVSGQVVIGVSTSSFRDLPRQPGADNVDAVIRALKDVRATRVELALANVEPAPPSTAPTTGGSPAYPQLIVLTPGQIAAVKARYRRDLREWRTSVDPGHFERTREKFGTAGIAIQACALEYDDACTDEEIDATFRHVKALGASTVSSGVTLAMAKRLAPFAERHRMTVAVHNQVDGNPGGAVATRDLGAVLAMSPAFQLKLDVGNVTASNDDAVAVLRTYQSRLAYVLVKDRLRNGGSSQHFGEGDTPLPAVLRLLKSLDTPVPAVVEYDYVGLHSSVEEVTASVRFVAEALK